MSSRESRLKPDHETQLKGDGVGVAHPMGTESKQAADTTTQRGAEALLAAEKRTLEMIAGRASLTDILENLCGAIALYLNVFVLIVQFFEKVPGLKAMAPTQSEPPFAVVQLLVLALFVTLTAVAAIRFRSEPGAMA